MSLKGQYSSEDLVHPNIKYSPGKGIIFPFSAQFNKYERDDLVLGGTKFFPNIVGKKFHLVTFYPKPFLASLIIPLLWDYNQ